MKKTFFYILAIVLCTTSLATYGKDCPPEDISFGWNTRELVTLYFHNSEPQTQWAWEALSLYRLKGDENVLDFGSGDGKLSALISFMVPQGKVTGFDISKEMVFYAKKMFPSYHYKNLTFQVSPDIDFSEVKFSEQFDVVTSFCVFHLVQNPITVLRNIKNQMKLGGHLIMTLPIGINLEFFQAASDEMTARGWNIPSSIKEAKQTQNPEKIQGVFSGAGFEVTSFKVVDTRFPFSSKEEMIDWFEGTLTANWNIPQKERRAFFTALADRYLKLRSQDIGDDGFVYFSLKKIDLVAIPKPG